MERNQPHNAPAIGEPERRAFMTIFKRMDGEGDGRTVEGYAAVFNSTTQIGGDWGYKEVIEPGAFDEALLVSDCRALFNHDANHLLARQSAKTLNLSVDSMGLMYKFSSPGTTTGNDILIMMERGDLRESSFAFTVAEQEWLEGKDENGDWIYTRKIKKIDRLFDVSPVTYPAYADTSVAARSLMDSGILTDEQKQYLSAVFADAKTKIKQAFAEGNKLNEEKKSPAPTGHDPNALAILFG
jgi:HK97 family phage prohead protease